MTEPETLTRPFTAFAGTRLLAAGPLVEVALAIKNAAADGTGSGPVFAFDDASGELVDLDLRGSKEEIVARLAQRDARPAVRPRARAAAAALAGDPPASQGPRARGRPRLGVVAREVTLLPRHWEWLSRQPGGASVTLRRLVELARKSGAGERRAAQEAAYRFMRALAGDLPGFEEATRALFADDRDRCARHMADWPGDMRDYALRLGFDTRAALS